MNCRQQWYLAAGWMQASRLWATSKNFLDDCPGILRWVCWQQAGISDMRYPLTELAGINLEIFKHPLFQELAWSVATNWPIARTWPV
jgi:hypothetical protein